MRQGGGGGGRGVDGGSLFKDQDLVHAVGAHVRLVALRRSGRVNRHPPPPPPPPQPPTSQNRQTMAATGGAGSEKTRKGPRSQETRRPRGREGRRRRAHLCAGSLDGVLARYVAGELPPARIAKSGGGGGASGAAIVADLVRA